MRGVRLSRWSMSYFTVAVVSLILAEGVWAAGLANPLGDVGSAWVLVGVHLTTIGFLTLLMLGALHQFVPVLTETELASQNWSGVTFFTVSLGLLGMVVGFLALPSTIPGGILPEIPWVLPMGGSLVVIGVVAALINLGVTLKRAWPWALPAWLVATGLTFLLLTVVAGLTFALAFAYPWLFPVAWLPVLEGRGLASHIIGGVGGWLTLTAMGVSYKLLAMFTLSNESRGVLGWVAYIATSVGIFGSWFSHWVGASGWAEAAWPLILLGLAAYLLDMRSLYRQRKRRQLELNARYGVIPLGFLASLVIFGAIAGLQGSLARTDLPLTFWALYGWLGGLALTQIYKIIPFLTWLNLFGSRMGQARMPRVQDLVDERRDRYAYLVYFAAVILGSGFLYTGSLIGFRIALGIMLVATLDIARGLYRAAHPGLSVGSPSRPTITNSSRPDPKTRP